MTTVTNNTGRIQGLRINSGSGMKTLILQPGSNDVSKSDLDALRKWKPFKAMCKSGEMNDQSESSGKDSGKDKGNK